MVSCRNIIVWVVFFVSVLTAAKAAIHRLPFTLDFFFFKGVQLSKLEREIQTVIGAERCFGCPPNTVFFLA